MLHNRKATIGEIFGAAGQVASAAISAGAVKDATDAQIAALEKQKNFVYSELAPQKISEQAQTQDVQRAQSRLALQQVVDPAALQARYAAENQILQQAGQIGQGAPQNVANVAVQEAITGVPGMDAAKKQLVDQALHELSLGATLPPDVQSEIVKAGLERSGMTTGAASPKGIGGTILRKVIGQEGMKLQADRQARATGLVQSAQNLETQRQTILGTLFPNLSNVQLNNLKGQQGVLAQSNQMVPEAGLGGSDIANIWLARVGATNQLAQSAADAAARGGMSQAQIWNQGMGGAVAYGAQALPSTASFFKSSAPAAAPTFSPQSGGAIESPVDYSMFI